MDGLPKYQPPGVVKTDHFDVIDPLDSRYVDPEVNRYLSEEARVGYQAYVEAALAHTLADFGLCSRQVAEAITLATQAVTAKEVSDREFGRGDYAATRHDIKALTEAIGDRVDDEAKPWVHALATSYDIVGTANVLQHKEAMNQVVLPRLVGLEEVLIELTEQYAALPQIGRTHGQHAVPVTFGFALSWYVGRIGESIVELSDKTAKLNGKFSGAVGAYNAANLLIDDPLAFEARVLEYLDLGVAEHSTQIVPPEPLARLLGELVIVGSAMSQVAEDMRHLQRTEIGEVGEEFVAGQTGSSAMPQKRNPISFENVASLSRTLTAAGLMPSLNLVSDHQRDLRDSASSRFYATVPALVAVMATRLRSAMAKLEVNRVAMERNLNMSAGLIGAEALQIALRQSGHPDAHTKAKNLVQSAREQGRSLEAVLVADDEIAGQYWVQIPIRTQQAILQPQNHYLGLAETKARQIATTWRNRLASLADKN